MQNFLIAEEINLEQLCDDFIKQTFGGNENITYDVSYYEENLFTPDYRLEIYAEIIFNSYKYVNGLGDERNETICVVFEDKGLKPFYIDGEFKTMEVYEAHTWCPIQKHDFIYGIEKEKLANMFYDFITTC